jgi:hypothetical protein
MKMDMKRVNHQRKLMTKKRKERNLRVLTLQRLYGET